MPGLLPNIDPDGLLEYSVVYTDRSLNHMSNSFQTVMNDVSSSLKKVYNSESVVLVPGGGTYGMEAVARQFATDKDCLVIRNGWFSYRWSQIFEMGNIPSKLTVLKASRKIDGPQEFHKEYHPWGLLRLLHHPLHCPSRLLQLENDMKFYPARYLLHPHPQFDS